MPVNLLMISLSHCVQVVVSELLVLTLVSRARVLGVHRACIGQDAQVCAKRSSQMVRG